MNRVDEEIYEQVATFYSRAPGGFCEFSTFNGLWDSDAAHPVLKTRVRSQVVKHRFDLEVDHQVIALLEALVQPFECALSTTRTHPMAISTGGTYPNFADRPACQKVTSLFRTQTGGQYVYKAKSLFWTQLSPQAASGHTSS